MKNKVMDMLGMVSKKKLDYIQKNNHEAMVRLRDRLADKKSKILKLENENLELKDKNRKLEKEYDNYDFRISLVNNKLVKKDNEIKELQGQNEKLKRELEYTKRYYTNRTLFLGLNNNIAFKLSYLLGDKDNEFRII